jgi:hypothetical protein
MVLEIFSSMNRHRVDKNRNSCGEPNGIKLSHVNFDLSAPRYC